MDGTAQSLVVVTGAGGFIGGHLVRHPLARGLRVRGVDCKPPGEWFQLASGAQNLVRDLTQRAACDGAAAVYNLAADMGGIVPLREADAYPAEPEDGDGWEKLFSERMCRHFREDCGLETRIVRYHNVYGPNGTYAGGREKAPAAICRKVIEAKLKDTDEIEIWGDGEQTRSFMFIREVLDWVPGITLEEGLERTYAWIFGEMTRGVRPGSELVLYGGL